MGVYVPIDRDCVVMWKVLFLDFDFIFSSLRILLNVIHMELWNSILLVHTPMSYGITFKLV